MPINSGALNTGTLNGSGTIPSVTASDVVIWIDTLSSTPISAPLLRENIGFEDHLSSEIASTLRDILYFEDTLSGTLTLVATAQEVVAWDDQLGVILSGSSVEGIVFSDTPSSALIPVPLRSEIIVVDQVSGTLSLTALAQESIVFADTLSSIFLQSTQEVIGWSDTLSSKITLADITLSDVIGFADTLSSAITQIAPPLIEKSVWQDALSSSLSLAAAVADVIRFSDRLITPLSSLIVVTHAETGAVSTYTLAPSVASIAEFGGVLYLAGPEGLYALDAEQDDTGPVVWTAQTGFSNWGTDFLKRVQDVNVQGRTAGVTACKVVVDRGGEKQQYAYPLPPVTRESYRDGVIKVGKGLQSVYWKIELTGTGPAEIDQMRVVFVPLNRRR